MSRFGWVTYVAGEDEDRNGTEYELEPATPNERTFRTGTGNAARDGYTAIARRPRCSEPGMIMSNDKADRVEEMYQAYEAFED